MDINTANVRKIIRGNFDLQGERLYVQSDGNIFTAKSRMHGLCAEVKTDDPCWQETLVSHIKWQCPHLCV